MDAKWWNVVILGFSALFRAVMQLVSYLKKQERKRRLRKRIGRGR